MAKIETSSTFRRLRNRYRLVIMNDDTFEEVATVRLSRFTVYVALSTIFVLLVGLTIAIVSFTNLKYLIPGYGRQSSLRELRMLKVQTDSLEQVISLKQQYLDGIQKVLRGDTATFRIDTTRLEIPTPDSISTD